MHSKCFSGRGERQQRQTKRRLVTTCSGRVKLRTRRCLPRSSIHLPQKQHKETGGDISLLGRAAKHVVSPRVQYLCILVCVCTVFCACVFVCLFVLSCYFLFCLLPIVMLNPITHYILLYYVVYCISDPQVPPGIRTFPRSLAVLISYRIYISAIIIIIIIFTKQQ